MAPLGHHTQTLFNKHTQDMLVKIGKKLKKNNVALDVVSFGHDDANAEKLEAFVAAVDSNENSHLVTVPAGTILSDMLFGSPIFHPDGTAGYGGGAAGGAGGADGAGGDGFDFVDPNIDPELALALRVSLEEERARQNAAAAAAQGGEGDAGAPAAAAGTSTAAAGRNAKGDANCSDCDV